MAEDLDQNQSDQLNYIAVRDIVEEDIVDLQSIMPPTSSSFGASDVYRIANRPLRKVNKERYQVPKKNSKLKNRDYHSKVIYEQRESEPEEIVESNSLQNTTELGTPPVPFEFMPNYIFPNIPIFSKRRRRFEKQTPADDAKLNDFRHLNDNKQQSLLRFNDEVVEQNKAFNGLSQLSTDKKSLHNWKRKPPRSTFDFRRNIAAPYRPRVPFSDSVMLHLRDSLGLMKSFKRSNRVKNRNQKNKGNKSKILQNRKEKQAEIESEGLTALSPTGQPMRINKLLKTVNTGYYIGNEIFKGNFLLSISTTRAPRNAAKRGRTMKDIKNSWINTKRTSEEKSTGMVTQSESITRKQPSMTILKNKISSLFSPEPHMLLEQREANQNGSLKLLQKATEVDLSSTLLYSSLNWNESFGTTDDLIQIDLFDNLATYADPPREKKALMEEGEKAYKVFHDWKKADLILTGLSGITALVLVAACITYGQCRRSKNYSEEKIKQAEENNGALFGLKKSAENIRTFFRLVMRKRKTPLKKKRHQSQDRIFTGKSNEEKFDKEGTHSRKGFSSKNTLPKHLIIKDSSAVMDSTRHNEINEDNSDTLKQNYVSYGENRYLTGNNPSEHQLRHSRSSNNDMEAKNLEKLTQPILRYSEPRNEKYESSCSDGEIIDAAVQTSFEDYKIPVTNNIKPNGLPSLPSISSDKSPSSSSERTDG
ncbi:uncharacterized protein NPIL_512711 [Nephila pilipes]|uniref:Uncharacterized protein n=1 Tax=Nephila pilipes TaxID=299642 RepID=A0A8X6UPI5_NEPPI|nr:uncharacterized protein NPIL_512711 [Nephila pilipes]